MGGSRIVRCVFPAAAARRGAFARPRKQRTSLAAVACGRPEASGQNRQAERRIEAPQDALAAIEVNKLDRILELLEKRLHEGRAGM
jgi:hypothetical protein